MIPQDPHRGSPAPLCPLGGFPGVAVRRAPGTLAFSSSPSGWDAAGMLESSRAGLALPSSDQTGVTFSLRSLTLWRYPSPFLFSFGIARFFVCFCWFVFFFTATLHQPPQLDDGRDPSLPCQSRSLEITKLLWDVSACHHLQNPPEAERGAAWLCVAVQLSLALRAPSVFTC